MAKNRKNNKLMILIGVVVVLAFVYAVVRPLTLSALYAHQANSNLSTATTEVSTALSGFDSHNQYTGNTACTTSWYKLSINCKTKTQDGTMALNANQRSAFKAKSVDMEQTLQHDGWLGNGWLKSFASNVVNYPATSTPSGVYRQPVRGGDCYFTFTSAYTSSSNTTTLSTQVWCDKGTPTYTY